ncbi:hypothetical protein HDV01_007305 [Terramyces sp. JEL0728]|nr:hypothetical protein HDV01_007305 [Terramyces sp. JEL0728]
MLQEKDAVIKELNAKNDTVISQKDADLKALSAIINQKDSELKELGIKATDLDHSAKTLTTNLMLLRGEISIRGAIESAMFKIYPDKKGGVQKLLDEFTKTKEFKREYESICNKFNCKPDEKVAPYFFSALSTYHHNGAYPIQCHLADNFISLTQWAMVITVFKLGHVKGAFDVYDHMEKLIDVYE